MKNLFRILAAVMGLSVSIHSQTYTIAPAICGAFTTPTITSCAVDLAPANALGIYPTVTLQDVNIAASTQATGYLAFGTVQGPGGYVGGAQVDSVTVDGPTLTIAFHGNYAPASGGASYTGTATLTVRTEQYRINRWTTKTVAVIESGTVAID